jgi:hypothetical protein
MDGPQPGDRQLRRPSGPDERLAGSHCFTVIVLDNHPVRFKGWRLSHAPCRTDHMPATTLSAWSQDRRRPRRPVSEAPPQASDHCIMRGSSHWASTRSDSNVSAATRSERRSCRAATPTHSHVASPQPLTSCPNSPGALGSFSTAIGDVLMATASAASAGQPRGPVPQPSSRNSPIERAPQVADPSPARRRAMVSSTRSASPVVMGSIRERVTAARVYVAPADGQCAARGSGSRAGTVMHVRRLHDLPALTHERDLDGRRAP